MTNNITLHIIWDDKPMTIELGQALGGGDGFTIIANYYHCGVLFNRQGKWQCYVNPRSGFCFMDVQAMIEHIVETYPAEYQGDEWPPYIEFIKG